ncbi:MAG: RidA family protein [Proteobacteria bacterium]|nr:RidA family protein [Pseudomonadota bacterium]MBS0421653.1 RidA family protein [Pseudomonadota bacterium]
MSSVRIIQSNELPVPGGHYSHATLHQGVLYISGQLGRTAGMSDAEAGDVAAQTRRALSSVRAILRAAGSELPDLLKVNIYIADVELWPAVNAAYAAVLGNHRPARAVIPTGPLHFGALVEIDAIAAVAHS